MSWQKLVNKSVTSITGLEQVFATDFPGLDRVTERYPMRINPYYLGLIKKHGAPLFKQVVPDIDELHDGVCYEDPLDEENLSPVPNLIHKYPDRVLFLVHNQCAVYCRFCTRKRKVGTSRMKISESTIAAGIEYLENTPAVRDVLVSGGDPFLLSDEALDSILSRIRAVSSVEIIRVGTRVPCVLPMRITKKFAQMLKKHHPLYVNTHFNHPAEITPEAAEACGRLADAGIQMGCQTVLLKGVNDDAEVMKTLMRRLLQIRVKPYYIFQTDMTKGTNHFRTTVAKGLDIMKQLIGHTSGLAVPTYAIDAPEGGGKIPLLPDYCIEHGETMTFRNYCGKICHYR
nr:KamA family radical SAM protein [Desulfobulbaceae bacterium]